MENPYQSIVSDYCQDDWEAYRFDDICQLGVQHRFIVANGGMQKLFGRS